MNIFQRGRLGFAALIATFGLVAGLAGGAFALSFTDTPGNFFEDEIDLITDAGCASGFNDGSFQPAGNTTRGQFAYWLNNCGGRVKSQSATNTLTYGGTAQQVVLTGSITVPGVSGSGQTQMLELSGIAEVGTTVNDFNSFCQSVVSCTIKVQLYNGGTKVGEQTATWLNYTGGMDNQFLAVPVQAVFEVPTGSTVNYGLRVEPSGLEASAGKVFARSLVATLHPFAG